MAANVTTDTQKFASRVEGLDSTNMTSTQPMNINNPNHDNHGDPFAAQRTNDNNPFAETQQIQKDGTSAVAAGVTGSPPASSVKRDRRASKEWDAAKVPPSRFQKPEGSIYATPSSRDGHIDRNTQTAYTDKLKEKGWA